MKAVVCRRYGISKLPEFRNFLSESKVPRFDPLTILIIASTGGEHDGVGQIDLSVD
jgi:hypothetical protein